MQIQWETSLLRQIELHIRHGDWLAMRASVLDPAGGVPLKAGEYWIRASVDQNILTELGHDPAAMTRTDYLRQGASFAALCASWLDAVEVAAEKKRRARHVH